MINRKYNVISGEEIVSISDNTSQEVIQLPQEVTLNSNYRITTGGHRGTEAAQTRPVTVSGSTHSQAAKSGTTSSTPANDIVPFSTLRLPNNVRSSDDKHKNAKHK